MIRISTINRVFEGLALGRDKDRGVAEASRALVGVSIYGTMAILVIAYLSRFLPLVLRPVAGAGLVRRILSIILLGMLPAATARTILVVMTALNELALSALLWSSGNETIGVMVFALSTRAIPPMRPQRLSYQQCWCCCGDNRQTGKQTVIPRQPTLNGLRV